MTWEVPVVHSVNRRKAWPFYALLLALGVPTGWLVPSRYIPYAVLALMGGLILWALLSREIFTRNHRRGMRMVRKKRFDEAIPHFEAAYAFMERHPWIDRWRSLVLLSISGMSYREMALCNVAFCYGQQGKVREATAIYEHVHREYPDNGIAISALNMLRGAGNGPAEG